MRRLVAGGWLRREGQTHLTALTRASFAVLEQNPAVLVAGREARTRDRGLMFEDRVEFAAIQAALESEGQK